MGPTGGSHTGKNENKLSPMKEISLGPTDGITNYIAGLKLTLEPDGNAFLAQSAVLNHLHEPGCEPKFNLLAPGPTWCI